MKRCFLALVILRPCLSFSSYVDSAFFDEADPVLNLLQVQARTHPAHAEVQQERSLSTSAGQGRSAPPPSQRQQVKQHGDSDDLEDGIAVVVPGLGQYDRAALTRRNIAWLKKQDIPFECTIFVYRNESVFPLKDKDFAPCKLIRHRGYWMRHLMDYPLNQTKKKWVLHLLDGIEPDQNVNLKKMIEIMKANGLSVASPTMPGYHVFPIMSPHLKTEPPGRLVRYIELQMDLFSRDYFACLQDVAYDLNPMGWGMSEALPVLCKGGMGLIDNMHMYKKFWGSYDRYIASQQKTAFYKHLKTEHPGFEPQSCRDEAQGQLMDPNIWWMQDLADSK